MSRSENLEDTRVPLEQLVERFFGPRPIDVQFEFGAASHQGLVRDENQDHYLVTRRRKEREVLQSNLPKEFLTTARDDAYALAVADGMGGQAFGKLASMLALRVGLSLGPDEIKWSTKINENEALELKDKIEVFLRLMDREIIKQTKSHTELVGMGTTLTVAYTVGREAFIAHVGDSRAYLLRENQLNMLTQDHTLANQMVEAGMISEGTYPFKRMRHVLTNCLGGPREGINVETHHLQLMDGDRMLLCTDGLTDMVADDDILNLIQSNSNCRDCAQALVNVALENGGKDNVTVIVASYGISEN